MTKAVSQSTHMTTFYRQFGEVVATLQDKVKRDEAAKFQKMMDSSKEPAEHLQAAVEGFPHSQVLGEWEPHHEHHYEQLEAQKPKEHTDDQPLAF